MKLCGVWISSLVPDFQPMIMIMMMMGTMTMVTMIRMVMMTMMKMFLMVMMTMTKFCGVWISSPDFQPVRRAFVWKVADWRPFAKSFAKCLGRKPRWNHLSCWIAHFLASVLFEIVKYMFDIWSRIKNDSSANEILVLRGLHDPALHWYYRDDPGWHWYYRHDPGWLAQHWRGAKWKSGKVLVVHEHNMYII